MAKTSYSLWMVLTTALLLFWPSIIHAESYGVPFRDHRDILPAQLILIAGHIGVGLVVWLRWMRKRSLRLPELVSIVLAGEGLALLLIMVLVTPYSRVILLGSVVASLASYVAVYQALRLPKPRLVLAGFALLASATAASIGATLFKPMAEVSRADGAREESTVRSAFYQLELIEFFDQIPRPMLRGGGLEAVDDGVLLVTGEGDFFVAELSEDGSALETRELNLKAPSNRNEFYADAPETIVREYFRVADLLIQSTGGIDRIFTSHHYWKTDQQCYVLRVSTTDWRRDEIDPVTTTGGSWETLYESEPCIGFDQDSLRVHQLMMSGGRMQLLNESELLLTVGDHGFDNVVYGPLFSQTPDVSYGKIIRVKIPDGTAEIFSTGHRNPQGLTISSSGDIWSTEHGPRGGDELNRIVQGRNYGWPFATFGTDYHMYHYPVPPNPRPQDPLYSPVFSWVPSIGVSSLIESRSPLFTAWNGDLLVASMRSRTLYRIQIEDERAVVVEPISIGGRVRDLVEDSRGRLVLWMDGGSIIVLRPAGQARTGSTLFATHCAACHDLDYDGRHSVGPDLGGIFNDPIGRSDNYPYSSALQGLSDTWNRENLRAFLKNPRAFSPGTTMNYDGLSNEDDIEDILSFLAEIDE